MRAVVISAGTVSDYEYTKGLINDGDFIVCADGGLAHCKEMGLKPDLIVGDFDSFSGELPGDAEIIKLQPEKDFSDTHVAVAEAVGRGYDELLLLGCTGTRLDHTLSNIGMLENLRRIGKKAVLADGHNLMHAMEKRELIRGVPGMSVSFIPLQPVTGITLRGFKYPLNKADIDMYHSIWLSNVLASDVGEVTFDSGVLIADIYND